MKPIHLTLISHALTEAQRVGRFHVPEDSLRPDALAVPLSGGETHARVLCAPEQRTRQTAMSFAAEVQVDEGLRDCDFGRWAGVSLKELQTREPEALTEWLADPASTPHGGESVAQLYQRASNWLEQQRELGTWIAVTHPFMLRVVMLRILDAPLSSFHRIDVSPLAELHLSFSGLWRLRLDG